jgi:hypothetical protein
MGLAMEFFGVLVVKMGWVWHGMARVSSGKYMYQMKSTYIVCYAQLEMTDGNTSRPTRRNKYTTRLAQHDVPTFLRAIPGRVEYIKKSTAWSLFNPRNRLGYHQISTRQFKKSVN